MCVEESSVRYAALSQHYSASSATDESTSGAVPRVQPLTAFPLQSQVTEILSQERSNHSSMLNRIHSKGGHLLG